MIKINFSSVLGNFVESSVTSYGKQLPRTSSTCMSSPAEAVEGLKNSINIVPAGEEKC